MDDCVFTILSLLTVAPLHTGTYYTIVLQTKHILTKMSSLILQSSFESRFIHCAMGKEKKKNVYGSVQRTMCKLCCKSLQASLSHWVLLCKETQTFKFKQVYQDIHYTFIFYFLIKQSIFYTTNTNFFTPTVSLLHLLEA
jgi:hypothetical protein